MKASEILAILQPWENHYGAKGLKARAGRWKSGRRIRKLSTLARLLESNAGSAGIAESEKPTP